jgi:hypothetical protein
MPTIFAPELFTRKRLVDVRKHDKHILENKGICPAILADTMGVTERFVVSRQRKLGLRPFTGNPPRKGAGQCSPSRSI